MEKEILPLPTSSSEAERYSRLKRRLHIFYLLLIPLYFIFLLESGLTYKMRDYAYHLTQHRFAAVAVYALLFMAGIYLIEFPIKLYSGYFLEHRFGLSTQSWPSFLGDLGKEFGLSLIFNLSAIEFVYILIAAFPDTWWLWFSGGIVIFMILMIILAPLIIIPLFFPSHRLEHPELEERLKRLAQKAGARLQGVYRMEFSKKTRSANAALTGLGRTRRILLADTLLNNFTLDEIEVIMGHELAHHRLRHHTVQIIMFSFLMSVVLFLTSMSLNETVTFYIFQEDADIANLPFLALIVVILELITFPLFAYSSRRLEYAADRLAVELTGKREAFESALHRLAQINKTPEKSPRWEEAIFMTHPTIIHRIARLRKLFPLEKTSGTDA